MEEAWPVESSCGQTWCEYGRHFASKDCCLRKLTGISWKWKRRPKRRDREGKPTKGREGLPERGWSRWISSVWLKDEIIRIRGAAIEWAQAQWHITSNSEQSGEIISPQPAQRSCFIVFCPRLEWSQTWIVHGVRQRKLAIHWSQEDPKIFHQAQQGSKLFQDTDVGSGTYGQRPHSSERFQCLTRPDLPPHQERNPPAKRDALTITSCLSTTKRLNPLESPQYAACSINWLARLLQTW